VINSIGAIEGLIMVDRHESRNAMVIDIITANQIERMVTRNVSARSELWARGPRGISDDNIDPRRDLNELCGFPLTGEMTPFIYRSLFDREAIANRVVNILPRATWAMQPSVYEDEDADTDTPFEQDWEDLCKGLRNDSWFQDEEGNPVFMELMQADIVSGIGSFGIILLGFNDGLSLEQPVRGYQPTSDTVPLGTDAQYLGIELDPPVAPERTPDGQGGSFGGPPELDEDEVNPTLGDPKGSEPKDQTKDKIKLLFMQSYDQSLVEITQFESDKNDPRFGQPIMYRVTFNDPRNQYAGVGLPLATALVHWTRVIHVYDNRVTSKVFGVPRQQPVLNNIINIQKLSGAGPEAAWNGAFMALAYESNPQLGGDVQIDIDKVADASERFFNASQRFLVGEAMTIKTLAPQVVDLSPQIINQITLICIQIDVPMRKFMGSEQGELASGQDDGDWKESLKARQQHHCTPNIICLFVDRMITVGVLRPPKEGYSVKWPELETVDPKDAAAVATAVTNAISSYVSGGCDVLVGPLDFLTHVLGPNLGFDNEVVEEVMKNALKHLQEANPDVDPEDLVHGRQPQPEVDPNSAEGMASAGVPMPPMVPGGNGKPKPYVDPSKGKDSARSKKGKVSVKNSQAAQELAAFMGRVREYNTVMNADPYHDPKTGQFTTGPNGSAVKGRSQVGYTGAFGSAHDAMQGRKQESDRLKQTAQGKAQLKGITDTIGPEFAVKHPHIEFVPHPKKLNGDISGTHQWYENQRLAYKQIEDAAKRANQHLVDAQHTDRAVTLSKKFLDAAFQEYGKRVGKITAEAEKTALDSIAPKPSRSGKKLEEKVLVAGHVGQKHTYVQQQISKSKLQGYLMSQKFHPGYTVTPVSALPSQKELADTPEFTKAKKELRRHIAKHAIAVLASGWAGTKAVSRDAAEKAVAKGIELAFKHGVKLIASAVTKNDGYLQDELITNEEYAELSKQDKIVTNLALILYPYIMDYVFGSVANREFVPGEDCVNCGASMEKGDDGICNSCGKPYDKIVKNANPNHDPETGRFAAAETAMQHSQHAQQAEHTETAWDSAALHERAASAHDTASQVASHPSQQEFHAQVADAHRVRAKNLRNAHRVATMKHVGSHVMQGFGETYTGQDPMDAAIGVGKGLIRGIFNEEDELVGVENYDRSDDREDMEGN